MADEISRPQTMAQARFLLLTPEIGETIMSDIETVIDSSFAAAETGVKAATITRLDRARAAYASGWPYWAPVAVLAALAGHLL